MSKNSLLNLSYNKTMGVLTFQIKVRKVMEIVSINFS